jgi:hypothetical protein
MQHRRPTAARKPRHPGKSRMARVVTSFNKTIYESSLAALKSAAVPVQHHSDVRRIARTPQNAWQFRATTRERSTRRRGDPLIIRRFFSSSKSVRLGERFLGKDRGGRMGRRGRMGCVGEKWSMALRSRCDPKPRHEDLAPRIAPRGPRLPTELWTLRTDANTAQRGEPACGERAVLAGD